MRPTASAGARGSVLPLDLATFRALFPGCPAPKAAVYLLHFNAACIEAAITTPRRLAAFCAQLGHESGDRRYWHEIASGAAHDTGRLAARLGNTPEADGDGQLFRGRGPIQLTGRANYRAAGRELGVDLEANPERAADPDVGFRVATWYWRSRDLSRLADVGDLLTITRRINGGLNGQEDRARRYRLAIEILGGAS